MGSDRGPMVDLYNLAWAPLAASDTVEIYDRHNGVPTLGVVAGAGGRILYWQCADLGEASLWVYVPLTQADVDLLEEDETGSLNGVVYGLARQRFATIGVAGPDNRLAFEREWCIPEGLHPGNAFMTILRYTSEVLQVALETELPPSRRDIVQHASDAARQLVAV